MMASNDGAIKGLALDMFFEEWDQLETLEEKLDAQFSQDIEEAVTQVMNMYINIIYKILN